LVSGSFGSGFVSPDVFPGVLCVDVSPALRILNKVLEKDPVDKALFQSWREELEGKQQQFPMRYPDRYDVIAPQHAIEVLHQETNGEAIITTGVGQHQMFAAQW
jgi:acetolactate synthase-1/2/3 large subunit